MNKEIIQQNIANMSRVNSSDRLYDMLLEIEALFDKFGIYAYRNWFEGEVVNGPVVKRHWISISLMYEYKLMPEPEAAKRLIKHGCKVKYKKTTRPVIILPHQTDREEGMLEPEFKDKKIWIIDIDFPRVLLDEMDDSFVQLNNEEVDNEEVEEFVDNEGDIDLGSDDGEI